MHEMKKDFIGLVVELLSVSGFTLFLFLSIAIVMR